MPQTDMQGNDYTNKRMDGGTARQCQAMCCSDPNCFAFTFADPQPTMRMHDLDNASSANWDCVDGKPCCWLKTRGAAPTGGCGVCTSGYSTVGGGGGGVS